MRVKSNYRIVTNFESIVGDSKQFAWKILDTKPLNQNKDTIRISGLGNWIHDKRTGECTRIATTKYRESTIVMKMRDLDVPVIRVDEIKLRA